MARNYAPEEKEFFKPGWARRPQHGTLYDESYIKHYVEDLTDMFKVGEEESARKIGEEKMREVLVTKYPNNFSIPSETDIKKFTNAMFQKSKKKEAVMITMKMIR